MSSVYQNKISSCRICGSNQLKTVIHLAKMPFTDEFISSDQLGTEFLSDIDIAVCKQCACAQNINDTDMGAYYQDYTYSVQSSGFALSFMSTLAERIKSNYFSNKTAPSILEIGSGTGEQLMAFKKLGFRVIGVEPSDKLSEYANSQEIKTLTTFFDENTTQIVDPEFRTVDAIVTSYTFDHIPRPVEVLNNIHKILNDDGLLIIEVHNLELIRQRNEFCLFEHEHYTYLNERTMRYLLKQNNFDVVTFKLLEESEKRANSLLVVAKKANKSNISEVDVLNEIHLLDSLNNEINKSISRIDNWLNENKKYKIVAYGAGGRGIMTIAALANSNYIQYIVDKNPKSDNIFAPKSHLPVYGIERLAENRADKILIFSFGYYNEIVSELTSKFGYTKDQFISILELLEPANA